MVLRGSFTKGLLYFWPTLRRGIARLGEFPRLVIDLIRLIKDRRIPKGILSALGSFIVYIIITLPRSRSSSSFIGSNPMALLSRRIIARCRLNLYTIL